MISVKDCGGVLDGIADDTAVLQRAVDCYKANTSASRVLVEGVMKFDPSAINYAGLSRKLVLEVNGSLKPTTTIDITSNLAIHGLGGAKPGIVQFTIGECCSIIPPAGNIPVIRVIGSADQNLKNISIYGCYIGLLADGANQLGALLRMENVNVLATQPGGVALKLDAFFWVWAKNCKFLATEAAAKSLVITNTSATYSSAGLHFFQDCITAGRGISVSPDTGTCGNIYFRNHHHESLPAGEDFFYAKPGTYNVTFDQLGLSDPLPGAGYAFDVAGVQAFRVLNSFPMSFKSLPASMTNETDWPFAYTNATREIGSSVAHAFGQNRGAVSARLLSRGHMTMASPGIGIAIPVPVPTGVVGGLTFTPDQIAPDGTATATKVVVSAEGAQYATNLYLSGRAVGPGDYVVLYAMVKMLDRSTGGNSDTGVLNVGLNTSGVAGVSLTSKGRTANEAAPAGPDHALADDGWMPAVCAYRSTMAGTPDLYAALVLRKASAGMLLWKPCIRVIPASYGFTDADIVRLTQSFGGMHAAKTGVVSVMEHQCTRSGLGANRPDAASVGQGAQFFDTALSKPIWSDGASWRDATGAIA